ncbi:MAG: hypothetical protein K8U57_07915 [Planctomycetes bacterium]|nr:hypothetical protein [Planctomycetota bacterium]
MNDNGHRRTCGFRLSVMDVCATVVVGVLSYVSIQTIGPFAILLPFVFGHFLLFCNVFRIGTDLNAYLNDTKQDEGFVVRTVRRLFRSRETDPSATRREEKHP